MPIVADAAAKISADMTGFERDLKVGGERATKTLGQQLKSVFSPRNLAIAGVAGGVALAAAITAGLGSAVRALIDVERLNAQTDAVIRSTGGVANVTREQIEAAADAAEAATTIEREAVQEAQNLLLTFTNIRDRAGEGNDIFTQTTESVLDMSVAMGTDARSAAMQLGKALNDPVKGMAQLARSGVQFTEDQKELVAELVRTGDLLGAQKVILAELETQFGGSAEAFADTTAGKIQRFQNDIGNMFESIILGAIKVGEAIDNSFKNSGLDEFAMNFGDQGDRVHDLADRMGEDFDDLKEEIGDRMHESGESFDEAITFIEQRADGGMAQVHNAVRENLGGTLQTIEAMGADIKDEWDGVAEFIPQAIRDRWDDTRRAAFQIAIEHAKGILDGQNQVKLAFEVLTQLQEEEQTRAQRISYLQGLLSSTELAAGLNDGRPGVRGAASALRSQILAELAGLGVDAYNSGLSIPRQLASGMYAGAHLVDGASSYLAAKISGYLPRSEPKEGPLRGITKVGDAIVHSITDGIYRNLAVGEGAARALAGSLMPSLTTPAFGALSAAEGMGGGVTFVLQVDGEPKVIGTREDVLDGWDQLRRFGKN